MSSPPTLLFVSRDCLLKPTSGGAAYASDILKHLDERGYSIDLVLLIPSHLKWGGIIPAFLPGTRIRVRSPSFFRLGKWLLNPVALGLLPVRLALRMVMRLGRIRILRDVCQSLFLRMRKVAFPSRPKEGLSYFETDPTDKEIAFVRRQIQRHSPKVVVLNYICLTPILDQFPEGMRPKAVVLAHDLWHLRAQNLRAAGLEPDLKEWTREEESFRYRKADKVIGISLEERPVFQQMVGADRVMTLPKSIKAQNTGETPLSGRCLFVGTDMPSNVDGLEWFLGLVWPQVRRRVPEAELHVCGTICRKLSSTIDGVVLRGVVENLGEAYGTSQLVVVPIRTGSGVKIKLTEAVAYKRCCVATTCGMEGLPAPSESGVLIADRAEAFAEHVIRLLSDSGSREECLARMAAWTKRHMRPEICYRELCDFVESA